MEEKKIKIALIDDEILFRKSIIFLLGKEENIEIVFDGKDGYELLDYLKKGENIPDIVITDIRMPGLDGLDTTLKLTREYPDIKIIALTNFQSERFIDQMITYGVSSYILKDTEPEEVIYIINQVDRYGIYFNNAIMNIIVRTKRNDVEKDASYYKLSEREAEILNMICNQKNTKEIADSLCLSERTVEGHRKKLLEKTESKNVVGLVLWAIRHHLYEIVIA